MNEALHVDPITKLRSPRQQRGARAVQVPQRRGFDYVVLMAPTIRRPGWCGSATLHGFDPFLEVRA